ncbi:MAG: hypothetical protein M0D53_15315 [Flavobacterium sp. JAD_PAG50586_2]|nr:MAG: hypothetical protein M0D53_15315 [Flavobacterium sp. JAD_PAG50586_2]
MKYFARLFLTVFVLFLSTPTVVTLIKKTTDTSIFYSFAEEEIHKELKEVKAEVKQHFDYPFLDLKINKNTTIISDNLSRHDNVAAEIFLLRPNLFNTNFRCF